MLKSRSHLNLESNQNPISIGFKIERIIFMMLFAGFFILFSYQAIVRIISAQKLADIFRFSATVIFQVCGLLVSLTAFILEIDIHGVFGLYKVC